MRSYPNILILILAAAAVPAAVAQPGRFKAVKGWKGTLTVELQHIDNASLGALREDHSYSRGAKFDVLLDQWVPELNGWRGFAKGRGAIDDKTVTWITSCGVTTLVAGTQDLAIQPVGGPRTLSMVFDRNDRFYFLPSDSNITTQATVIDCKGNTTMKYERRDPVVPALREDAVSLPDSGYDVFGVRHVTQKNAVLNGMVPAPEVVWKVSWDLTPTAIEQNEVELVIEPSTEYATWIPEGASADGQQGNSIGAVARLRMKNGAAPNVKAQKISFEMFSSQEPGFAMNFPTLTWNRRYDLSFDAGRNPKLRVWEEGQRAETTQPGVTEAPVVITSIDFGSFGKLKATATLEDGRTITGRFNGDEFLRLPKRTPDSYIADAWKEQMGVTGKPDDADEDDLPAGDGHKGDGLTLYEEYRGFFVAGKHIRTRPDRKDLFIRDDIGGKTKPGILLFAAHTGLTVHHELTEDELLAFPDRSYVNANSGEGAHLGAQCGVVIMEAEKLSEGALAWSNTNFPRIGPPCTVDLVGVSPTPGTGAPHGDVPYYTKIIAHELLHCVNVPHHGDTDFKISMNLKRTPGGKYVLWTLGFESLYRLYSEAEGVEMSQAFGEAVEKIFRDEGKEDLLKTAVESPQGLKIGDLTVGVPGGQHSGAERCLMRYEFAKAYLEKGRSDSYIYFEDQNRGGELCTSPKGTGVNDAKRVPQSRHGDATQGNCAAHVCVNDRIRH